MLPSPEGRPCIFHQTGDATSIARRGGLNLFSQDGPARDDRNLPAQCVHASLLWIALLLVP
jgi:hypothetical protein